MPSDNDVFLAIFDHDGVLVDSLELHTQAWVEMGAGPDSHSLRDSSTRPLE